MSNLPENAEKCSPMMGFERNFRENLFPYFRQIFGIFRGYSISLRQNLQPMIPRGNATTPQDAQKRQTSISAFAARPHMYSNPVFSKTGFPIFPKFSVNTEMTLARKEICRKTDFRDFFVMKEIAIFL